VCLYVCLCGCFRICLCVFACVSRCSATQRAGIKLSEEERHRVAMDLKDRLAKVTVLKAKYDTLCARMKAEEGEEERSQAYFVIKAAQRREELQREGDELVRDVPRRAHVHSSCVAVALVGARAVARAAAMMMMMMMVMVMMMMMMMVVVVIMIMMMMMINAGSQDAAIRKAEREVKALVATLKQLAESNTAYRVGHQSVCACVVVVRCDASCRLVSAARA
jgi:hypothetical protein